MLLEWLLPPCLRLVGKDCTQPVVCQDINLVMSLTRLLQALLLAYLQPAQQASARPQDQAAPPKDLDSIMAAVECFFIFSLVWSLGAVVDLPGRALFSSNLRKFVNGSFGDYQDYVTGNACPIRKPLPAGGTVYDWVYDSTAESWKGRMSI